VSRPKGRNGRAVVTTHLAPEIGREVERLALERGVSKSAVVAALVGEALLAPIEHQHGALIEGAIERAVGRHLERLEDLTHRASRESYRGRWLVARMLALLGDRIPPAPSQAAEERASLLNSESHRKARTWLGEAGWAEPS
jgi:hypothetical protein